jgi:hypothetical protein
LGKKLVQTGCKPELLTKRRIDLTHNSNNTTKILPGGPAGMVYPLFCEGRKFFSDLDSALLIIIIGLLLDFTSDNKMDSVYCSFSGNKRRLDTSGQAGLYCFLCIREKLEILSVNCGMYENKKNLI